jgi:hypothetical protein
MMSAPVSSLTTPQLVLSGAPVVNWSLVLEQQSQTKIVVEVVELDVVVVCSVLLVVVVSAVLLVVVGRLVLVVVASVLLVIEDELDVALVDVDVPWMVLDVVLVVGTVVVVGSAQPVAVHASQQLGKTPTQAVPPFFGLQASAPALVVHRLAPLRVV